MSAAVSFQDSHFFTLLFDCLLPSFTSKQDCPTLVHIVLDGLMSLCDYITDKNQQLHVIKRIIDFIFEGFQGHMKEYPNMRSVSQNEMERNKCVVGGKECKSDGTADIIIEDKHGSISEDSQLSSWCSNSQTLYCIEILMKLFTEQWKDMCNWVADNEDGIGQMDGTLWHPLHQWIVKLYAILGYINNGNSSQDSRICLFYSGLTAYIDTNATTNESNWILCIQQKRFLSDCIEIQSIADEKIDISGQYLASFMF